MTTPGSSTAQERGQAFLSGHTRLRTIALPAWSLVNSRSALRIDAISEIRHFLDALPTLLDYSHAEPVAPRSSKARLTILLYVAARSWPGCGRPRADWSTPRSSAASPSPVDLPWSLAGRCSCVSVAGIPHQSRSAPPGPVSRPVGRVLCRGVPDLGECARHAV
jgi:hypothetical protein